MLSVDFVIDKLAKGLRCVTETVASHWWACLATTPAGAMRRNIFGSKFPEVRDLLSVSVRPSCGPRIRFLLDGVTARPNLKPGLSSPSPRQREANQRVAAEAHPALPAVLPVS